MKSGQKRGIKVKEVAKARGLSTPMSAREGKADRPLSRATAALRPYGLDPALRVLASLVLFLPACLSAASVRAGEFVPAGSEVGALRPGQSLHLLSALELGSFVKPGGWHMEQFAVEKAAVPAKLGRDALTFRGAAAGAAKGDFDIGGPLPGETLAVGCWFHLSEGANVREVGLQFYDNEGEALVYLVPADWTGWKWVETPLTAAALKQAYPQRDKNGAPDMPIKGVHIVWWSKGPGASAVTVDGAVARVRLPEADRAAGVAVSLLGSTDVARGQQVGGSLLLTNPGDKPAKVKIELSLQRDGALYDRPLPDPVRGFDLARGAHSWAIAGGEKIAENTLTDGLDYTAAETSYRTNYWESADEFVELKEPTEITSMGWLAGDANWVWKVDVSSSTDGKTFVPVPELQGVDLHGKWGEQLFPPFKPVRAKVIRLHYHHDGKKTEVVRMPAALHLWHGVAEASVTLVAPRFGQAQLDAVERKSDVPAGSFDVIPFDFKPKLAAGQYLLAGKVEADKTTILLARHLFVEPPPLENVGVDSRFGLNAAQPSLAKEHRQLGIGWVRFENFKWPMVSPAPHQYAFDGTAEPWDVNLDAITRDYRDAGLNILPMMFLTPQWASGAGRFRAGGPASRSRRRSRPTSARLCFPVGRAVHGSRKIDADRLKTKDKVSGLNRIRYFELGNEPDLNPLRDKQRPPTWGAWAGTMAQWWEMWRFGAEAVGQADPNAVLVSPGFAGATAETVDQMRVHKYADGKSPLDYVGVLSVHFYSGRTPPEVARGDVNAAQGYDVTFIEQLKRLAEWRDRYKSAAPIWMTETGYDTGGPIGTNERTQAARLPRVVALCLANGVDKVLVYRESGSTPSQHAASGVLRDDLSRRPSWYTYATLIRELQGAKPEYHLPQKDDNLWLQTWRRDGKTMLMAYCVRGDAKLGVELGKATVTDAFGGVTQVASTRDLALSEFPLYISDMVNDSALEPLARKAKQRDQERKRQRDADAQRTAYLYCFGEPTEPLAVDIGKLAAYYTPVPASTPIRRKKRLRLRRQARRRQRLSALGGRPRRTPCGAVGQGSGVPLGREAGNLRTSRQRLAAGRPRRPDPRRRRGRSADPDVQTRWKRDHDAANQGRRRSAPAQSDRPVFAALAGAGGKVEKPSRTRIVR